MIVETRGEDGAYDSADQESDDDAGEFAKFSQAGFASPGCEGVI